MDRIEMVPSADSEEAQMEASLREVLEVRVSPATPRKDLKRKGKSVARETSTVKGKEKAREGGVDGDVEMGDQTGAGNAALGRSSIKLCVVCDLFWGFYPFFCSCSFPR